MHRFRTALLGLAITIALAGCALSGRHGAGHQSAAPNKTSKASGQGTERVTPAKKESPAHAVTMLSVGHYARKVDKRKAKLIASAQEPLPSSETGYYMDLQEANLRLALQGTGVGIVRRDERIILTLAGKLGFDTNTTQVSPRASEALAVIAPVLVQYPDTLLVIHGYTDPTGNAGHNLRLSKERAHNIARQLIDNGVTARRLVAIGHGEAGPMPVDTSPKGHPPDRRIEIHLTPLSQ